jgi:hypothetical protein
MQEKKKYRGAFAESQRVALESCFQKPPRLDFHEKAAFDAEVERRLGMDDDRSTTGAVKIPFEAPARGHLKLVAPNNHKDGHSLDRKI